MKILYSAIGTTDPIRGCYDGAMLHIIRHYKPDMAVLFLSKEMVDEEERNQQYTKAILYVNPQCEVRLIKTELQEVHKIDTLYSLVEEFYKLKDEFSDAEFLINLTSGTPQMCQLLTYLAIENLDTIGIQVDTPTERSNRSEHALQGDEDIDFVIECNVDNEVGTISRCHEPVLRIIKRRFLKERCISLVKAYEYKEAYQVFKEYKKLSAMIDEHRLEFLTNLLQHSIYRSAFQYDESLPYVPKDIRGKIVFSISSDKRDLLEYLYISQIRIEKGMNQDFIVKLTPYLFQFMKYILKESYGVHFKSIESISNKGKIDIQKLSLKYPSLYKSWEQSMKKNNFYIKDFELSFFHMFNMIKYHSDTKGDLVHQLEVFLPILKKLRNKVAHEIGTINNDDIREASGGKDCQQILLWMRTMLEVYLKIPKAQLKLVYSTINDCIINELIQMK